MESLAVMRLLHNLAEAEMAVQEMSSAITILIAVMVEMMTTLETY